MRALVIDHPLHEAGMLRGQPGGFHSRKQCRPALAEQGEHFLTRQVVTECQRHIVGKLVRLIVRQTLRAAVFEIGSRRRA